MNNKKIIFNPSSKDYHLIEDSIKKSRNFMPEWYKKTKVFSNNKPNFSLDDGQLANKTIKLCQPFYDSITAGYIQSTWQEIYVENNGDNVNFFYPTSPPILSYRSNSSTYIPEDFVQMEFTWTPPFWPQVPKGYSILITHPLNRIDLPFYTACGIVDSDQHTHVSSSSNLPFFIKKGFSGIIPVGTPMYQMIPIKRESWESSINEYDEEKIKEVVFKNKKFFWGGYKKQFWNKKNYN